MAASEVASPTSAVSWAEAPGFPIRLVGEDQSEQTSNMGASSQTQDSASDTASDDSEGVPIDLSQAGEIESPERARVLSVVDQLRDLGINDVFSLPQLVVFGDQSTGKSSLLEALTGIPFPVYGQLCTRFATQVTLRRSATKRCAFSIIPGHSRNDDAEARQYLRAYTASCSPDNLTETYFSEQIQLASEAMGINVSKDDDSLSGYTSSSYDQDQGRRMSDDILKVEVSGPEKQDFTIVDVPGLFRVTTHSQTAEDKKATKDMIIDYMRQPRTIIIALMDANTNLHNQEAFDLRRKYDPEGARTVGVITKPDRIEKGNEFGTMKVANNIEEPLHHGWFVVRNRSPQEVERGVTMRERHEIERSFFESQPWADLNSKWQNCGIGALKKKLGELLFEHTSKELPNLRRELEHHLDSDRKEIERLGPYRESSEQQRKYLLEISRNYQQHVIDALNGHLEDSREANSPLLLQKHVNDVEKWFADEIEARGKTYTFDVVDKPDSTTLEAPGSKNGTRDRSISRNRASFSPEVSNLSFDFGEMSVHDKRKNNNKQDINIYRWIEDVYRRGRGNELPGLINPTKVEVLFREQSRNWDRITDETLMKADNAIASFNKALLNKLVGDHLVRQRLIDLFAKEAAESYSAANTHLSELLKHERVNPSTMNEEFTIKLNAMKNARFLKRLRKCGFEEGGELRISWEAAQLIYRADLPNYETGAVNDLHDILKAYYEISLPRFKDNFRNAVIRPLLNGAKSPVRFFTVDFVCELTNAQLDGITAEAEDVRKKRSELMASVAQIEAALRTIWTAR